MTTLRPDPLPPTRDYLTLSATRRTGWVELLGAMTSLGARVIDLYLPAFPDLRGEPVTSASVA